MHNVQQQLFSGALSGLATTICLQPFDLVKTRMQQGDGLRGLAQTQSGSVILRTTREVISKGGLKGLWRGTMPSLARNVPGLALYMSGLTQLRAYMARFPYFASAKMYPDGDPRGKNVSVLPTLTMQGNLVAGTTSRVAVSFLMNPFSLLKARYESNYYKYQSFPTAFLSIARQGPSELLRGFLATSLRDAPYAGLFVVFYEAIKRETSYLLAANSGGQASIVHALSAASAGGIATLATHPFDVIKTKLQVRNEERYRGFMTTVVTLWKQRGIVGYFDGASLRLSRKVFSSAIAWAVYEGLLLFFWPV